ncbi:hypothetical protein [Streptomyces sp. NEAU-S7GS2]|uniref:hypothetical protein n=1 Tax=Streptomyces sp. NEAU-S7GS2 TaxID=2202000 RepID=UPI0013A5B979|nr:hypothetical protein [Streptomyces sp. NEAU-S7GS2]
MLFAGCDWSDRWLDVAVLDRSGSLLGKTRIVYSDSPDPVARYREFLAPLGRRWRATVTGIEDVHILFGRLRAWRSSMWTPPALPATGPRSAPPRRIVPMRG